MKEYKTIAIITSCLLLYLLISLPLFDWIIDDAGITFSYAKSLADGYGLVSQPGMEPVEGYSNFLWLLLFTPFLKLGIFNPYFTPKIISFLLVSVTYFYIHKSIFKITKSYIVSTVVLLSLSLNTSFVTWTCSGLENPLYIALISILFYSQIKILNENKLSLKDGVISAFLVTAIALTRPDGILYAIVLPVALVFVLFATRFQHIKETIFALGSYLLTIFLTFGAFILFRWIYFNDIYPNTYYVKASKMTEYLELAMTVQEPYLGKLLVLIGSIVTLKAAFFVSIAVVSLSSILFYSKKFVKFQALTILFLALSGFIYLILPDDWMGEYRFATPFFVFFYLLIFVQLHFAISLTKFNERIKLYAMISLSACIIGVTLWKHIPRFKTAYRNKIVSFERIANAYAFKFNDLAKEMNIENGSILLPDIGATLYYSDLKVYDMTGLTDKVIAKTLRKNNKAFHNYVFEDIKPTFIHIHGNWTLVTNFDSDERFRRDYQPIEEHEDKWIKSKTGKTMMSGDYVRKDIFHESDEGM